MASCNVRTKNPTFSEVALALRENPGMEDVTHEDVSAAARKRGVPIKDCRLVTSRHCSAVYFQIAAERGLLTEGGTS